MSVNLQKATEEVKVNLTKRGIINVPKDINVSLLLDYSYSMSSEYANGNVAKVLQRLLSISNTIDDDGNLELVLFESNAHHYGTLNVNQFDDVNNIIKDIKSKYSMGGTAFAPPVRKILNLINVTKPSNFFSKLFKKDIDTKNTKQLLVLISDGDNSDKDDFNKMVKTIESLPNVYLQCIAIGYQSNYLKALAENSNSVGYSCLSDFTKTNDELIESIISQELIQKFS